MAFLRCVRGRTPPGVPQRHLLADLPHLGCARVRQDIPPNVVRDIGRIPSPFAGYRATW